MAFSLEMAFKGLSWGQATAHGKVGNVTWTEWFAAVRKSFSHPSVYVSHSAYLFWPLQYLCTLKIIEKMKHVLYDVFSLGTFAEDWMGSWLLLSAGTFTDGNGYWVNALVIQISIAIYLINFTKMGHTSSHREVTGSSCFKVQKQKCGEKFYCKTLFSHGEARRDAKSVTRE